MFGLFRKKQPQIDWEKVEHEQRNDSRNWYVDETAQMAMRELIITKHGNFDADRLAFEAYSVALSMWQAREKLHERWDAEEKEEKK